MSQIVDFKPGDPIRYCGKHEIYFHLGSVCSECLNEQVQSKPSTDAGTKFDAGKLKWSLASTYAIEAMLRVLMYGAKKYGERNWEKGLEYSRIIDAIYRHLAAYVKGERIDPETGESHMASIMTNAHFLLHFEATKTGKDDMK